MRCHSPKSADCQRHRQSDNLGRHAEMHFLVVKVPGDDRGGKGYLDDSSGHKTGDDCRQCHSGLHLWTATEGTRVLVLVRKDVYTHPIGKRYSNSSGSEDPSLSKSRASSLSDLLPLYREEQRR